MILRIILNILGLAAELALIVGVAWLALNYPWVMAGLTTVLIITLGSVLEWSRQRHEDAFYFGDQNRLRLLLVGLSGVGEGLVKALAAGAALMLTFAGDDSERIFVLVVIFAACLFLGTGILRRGFYMYNMRPSRWGYFRLAVPLGIVFSAVVQGATALGFLVIPSLQSIAGSLVFDLPQRPTVEQLSDLAFKIRQTIDALVTDVAGGLLGEAYAPIIAVLVSVDVLIGFALAVYVVVILEIVLRLEGARGYDGPKT